VEHFLELLVNKTISDFQTTLDWLCWKSSEKHLKIACPLLAILMSQKKVLNWKVLIIKMIEGGFIYSSAGDLDA